MPAGPSVWGRSPEPTEAEWQLFAQVKEQVKGQVVLSLDSAGSRLYRLAGHALRGEEVRTPEEVLARIDAVTEEQLAQVASEFFDPATCLSLRLGR